MNLLFIDKQQTVLSFTERALVSNKDYGDTLLFARIQGADPGWEHALARWPERGPAVDTAATIDDPDLPWSVDTRNPHDEAGSAASGLIPPRWLSRHSMYNSHSRSRAASSIPKRSRRKAAMDP